MILTQEEAKIQVTKSGLGIRYLYLLRRGTALNVIRSATNPYGGTEELDIDKALWSQNQVHDSNPCF